MAKGYSSPLWMTYRQAGELKAHVRKGEQGSLVVFADRVAKTETNDQGEEVEREIAFMKGYTVFNVEQIEGLPGTLLREGRTEGRRPETHRIRRGFLRRHRRDLPAWRRRGLLRPRSRLHPASAARSVQGRRKLRGGQRPRAVHWSGHPSRLARVLGNGSAITLMPRRNSLPSSAPPSSALTSASRPSREPIMPRTWRTGSRF